MRQVGAVVVGLGVLLVAAAVLMAAVPFSTVEAGGGAARVDCGIPWLNWAGGDDDRCTELARSRVDGAATVALLAMVVMSVGFVARRRRPVARRGRRRPVTPVPPPPV